MKPDLLNRFIQFSQSNQLFSRGQLLVVGVSGGGDSMALVDLLARYSQPMILAHCNFNLRGEESDLDEEFVRKIALVYDTDLEIKHFDTRNYARMKGISIEMAARELRYPWLEKIRIDYSAHAIAVGHHSDDSIETMLINLIRGTGLRGLSGIRAKQGNIIRPMLFTNRLEIYKYLDFRKLEQRFDSSNNDLHFVRNRIRHIILPEMERINPSVRSILLQEQDEFEHLQLSIDQLVDEIRRNHCTRDGGRTRISLDFMQNVELAPTLLFNLLKPFGFHGRQVIRILDSRQSGKIFRSQTHQLLRDRNNLIIDGIETSKPERYYFHPDHPDGSLPFSLESRLVDAEGYMLPNDPKTACLDFDKLDIPLIFRTWERGDFFHPLGMDHPKKLSDFYIDQKINRFDKDRTWLLASGEQIIWVVGHRIDHRFRITPETTRILELKVSLPSAT